MMLWIWMAQVLFHSIIIGMVLQESPELFGLEVANFTINMIFLVLFICRFVVLRSFARTERFEDYFPKLRIFFSLVYVVVNIGLLVETVVLNQFEYTSFDIVLVVLGEGINSIILFIQLLVLRLELLKEQPYTIFHVAYFLYLCLFSAARLTIFLLNEKDQFDAINITLSSILIADSLVQFTYWVVKKQSLPQFQVHTNAQIDFKHHSRLIENILDTDRSFRKPSQDAFPYIVPFVSVDNGRIKVILEIASPSQISVQDNTSMAPKTFLQPTSKAIQTLGLNRQTRSQDTSNREQSRQILSSSYYSIEQIKNLYVVCGRFPMKKSLSFHFSPLSLPEMAKDLQTFLIELFQDRRWYQPSVLKYLRIPLDRLKEYSDMLEKYSACNKDTDLDQTIGLKVVEDKNATFFSVSIYKHLWIDDHYQFYMKVVSRQTQIPYYPIKRFSEFEDFNNALKHTIKTQDKDLQLPILPKKHLFHWNQDQQVNQRRAQLERYLRLLSNDYLILSVPAIKQLLFQFLGVQDEVGAEGLFADEFYRDTTVTKGEVSKCLIRNDLVTYYEFKVFQQGIEICILSKRFSQFEELHRELERWMHNIQITYKAVVLPERLYYKSEAIRHEKLKNYLQAVMEIRDVGKLYFVNSFFNIAGSEGDDISEIAYNSRMDSKNVMNQVIELAQNIRPNRFSESEESSRRFSQIINNLGDPAFD